jgi:hypothetical protein
MGTISTVKETSSVSGATADVVLAGAVPGYRRFAEVVGDGNSCNYGIVGAGLWEARLGKYHAGNNSLTRGIFLASCTGAPVDFPAGVKRVFHKQPASLLSELAEISGSAGAAPAGGIQAVEMALTIAQLRTLSATRIELVPAPGANKLAMPREFYYRFIPATPPVAFDFSNSFQYALSVLGSSQDYFGNMQSNGLQPAFGMMSAPDWSLGYVDLLSAANQPITLTATPIGGGDGSGWVRCYYEVIDLA